MQQLESDAKTSIHQQQRKSCGGSSTPSRIPHVRSSTAQAQATPKAPAPSPCHPAVAATASQQLQPPNSGSHSTRTRGVFGGNLLLKPCSAAAAACVASSEQQPVMGQSPSEQHGRTMSASSRRKLLDDIDQNGDELLHGHGEQKQLQAGVPASPQQHQQQHQLAGSTLKPKESSIVRWLDGAEDEVQRLQQVGGASLTCWGTKERTCKQSHAGNSCTLRCLCAAAPSNLLLLLLLLFNLHAFSVLTFPMPMTCMSCCRR